MTVDNPEDEILVDIPADDTPVVEIEKTKTPEDEGVDALKAQVEEHKRQREAERVGREDADRRAVAAAADAARAREEASRSRTEASTDRMNAVITAIDNVSKEAEMAQARLEAAAQNGDFKALAVAQREISRAEARLLQLENNKTALEEEAKNPTPQRQAEAAPAHTDPVERYVALNRISPRSAEWMRSHRDVIDNNGSPTPKLLAAHYHAVAHSIGEGTDAYYAHLEQQMGYMSPVPQDRQAPGQVVNLEARRTPMATAPVSRDSPSAPPSPTSVRLSPEQLEAAEISGMTPQEYAKSLLDPRTKAMLANGQR
jgi:hypothetical protein